MQISAEVRWFWHAAPPARFKDWFLSDGAHPYRAGGGKTRPDDYLYDPSQVELGIKARGGKAGTEIKGLVAQFPNAVPDGPFKGDGELWTKWTSNALRIDSLPRLLTNKTRALRKFDATGPDPKEIELGPDEKPLRGSLPAAGCNVELTQVEIKEKIFWTLGFEAFGDLQSVIADLRSVASLLAARKPPPMENAVAASYPAWLAML